MAAIDSNPNATFGVHVTVREMTSGRTDYDRELTVFPVLFGRSENCHLAFPGLNYLSRSHGSIHVENGQIIITDLNSLNGILIDKKRITTHAFDSQGDFLVGNLKFTLRLVEKMPVDRPNFSTLTSTSITMPSELIPIRTRIDLPSSRPSQPPPLKVPLPIVLSPEIKVENRAAPRLPFSEIDSAPGPGLRAVLFWENDVMDVRQYLPGDQILVGHDYMDPLVLPTLLKRVSFGHVSIENYAEIDVQSGTAWEGKSVNPDDLVAHKDNLRETIILKPGALLNISVSPGIRVQFSFAEISRPFLKRTWIENKEEMKRAVRISSVIHTLIFLAALFASPKQEAPRIENMPTRFAKLLVQPPKQIFTPQPPPPPPPPPEPKVEEPKPEPLKMAQPTKPKKSPVAKKSKAPNSNKPVEKTASKPAPSEADQLLSALNTISSTNDAAAVDLTQVKVNSTNEKKDFSTTNVMNSLQSKAGKLARSGENLPMMNGSNVNFKGVAGNNGKRVRAGNS